MKVIPGFYKVGAQMQHKRGHFTPLLVVARQHDDTICNSALVEKLLS